MARTWNQKQREIFALFQEGKTFDQVAQAGYPKSTAARVLKEFRAGNAPPDEKAEKIIKVGGTSPVTTIKAPAAGITQFEIGQERVPIYPEDMMQCFDNYRDMKQQIGWQSDFSSTLREGMRMLRAIVMVITPEEEQNDTGNTRDAG